MPSSSVSQIAVRDKRTIRNLEGNVNRGKKIPYWRGKIKGKAISDPAFQFGLSS